MECVKIQHRLVILLLLLFSRLTVTLSKFICGKTNSTFGFTAVMRNDATIYLRYVTCLNIQSPTIKKQLSIKLINLAN